MLQANRLRPKRARAEGSEIGKRLQICERDGLDDNDGRQEIWRPSGDRGDVDRLRRRGQHPRVEDVEIPIKNSCMENTV